MWSSNWTRSAVLSCLLWQPRLRGFRCPGTPNLEEPHPAPPGSNSWPCPATQECGRASGIHCGRRGETAGRGAAGALRKADRPGSGSQLKPWPHSSARAPFPGGRGGARSNLSENCYTPPTPSGVGSCHAFRSGFRSASRGRKCREPLLSRRIPVLVAVAGHLVRAARLLVSGRGEWHSPPRATAFELHPSPPPFVTRQRDPGRGGEGRGLWELSGWARRGRSSRRRAWAGMEAPGRMKPTGKQARLEEVAGPRPCVTQDDFTHLVPPTARRPGCLPPPSRAQSVG